MDGFTLDFLIQTLSGFITRVSAANLEIPNRSKKQNEIKQALVAIQTAVLHTRTFIINKGYEPNLKLSELWMEAFAKVVKVEGDEQFPQYLYQKAKFWSEPQNLAE